MAHTLPKNYFLLLLLFFTVSFTVKAQVPDTVSIYLGWTAQFQFAGYYAAKEMGYYEEEGLYVNLVEGGKTWGIEEVVSGQYEYGIATGGHLLTTTHKNELTVLAAIFQTTPLMLVTQKDRGIHSLDHLLGKKVAADTELKAMLKSAGVNLNAITFTRPTTDTSTFTTNDAITYYITDYHKHHDDFHSFRPVEYGIDFYGESLYTTRKEGSDHPERVQKILNATIKGWQYAVDHPRQIIRWLTHKYGSTKSQSELQHEANIVIYSLVQPLYHPIGEMNKEKWTRMGNILHDFNETESLDDEFYNNFIYNSPEKREQESLKKIIHAGSIIVLSLLLISLVSIFFIYQLKRLVKQRTEELEKVNNSIEQQNLQLKKQKSELEEHNRFKDQMISLISHDVKAPLNSFQGLVYLINHDSVSLDEIKTLMKDMGYHVHEIISFIENLVYWARNQLDGIHVNREKSKLCIVTEKTISLYTQTIRSKGIEIKNEIVPGTEAYCDREMLKLIIRNLISNAVKFCDTGDLITVSTKSNGETITLIIQDTGAGMSEEELRKLFGAEQVIKTGSKNEQGTGLGLQMCHDFVKLNDGTIEVTSTLGEGSTFYVTFPKEE